jgi:ankyrin repeat protein
MALQSKLRNLIIDGDYESLKMFLDTFKNVDLNYVYPNGILTILSIALVYYNEECIKLLVDRGMNVDLPYNIELGEQKNSINGMSALLIEVKFGCINKVKFLLNIGASLYFRTNTGQNILDVTTDEKTKKFIKRYVIKKRSKLIKILYSSIKSIDEYAICRNIVDFLYPIIK